MKITWQDAFTINSSTLDFVKKDIPLGTGLTESFGDLVYEDEDFVVLCTNRIKNMTQKDDFLIIPKSLIKKRNGHNGNNHSSRHKKTKA